jgi:spore coat protein A, manganese oxidase
VPPLLEGAYPLITRRAFLKRSCAGGALLAARTNAQSLVTVNRPSLDPNLLPKFVDPLPIPAIVRCYAYRSAPAHPGVKLPYYRIEMREFWTKVHRDLNSTKMWGFNSAFPGPTLEARSGKGFLVEWVNSLPQEHFLPVDYRLGGARDRTPGVKAVVHLHGARVPPDSDGSPEHWYRPGRSALCHYPNHQDSATLWYHDHVMGTNRLNTFAGLLGLCIVRDGAEDKLNLPKGKYEIPLVICDRLFDHNGQLNYPVSGKPGAPWVPEVFGNAILVNGKLFPYLQVEPRRYRFRVLNGSNGRFYHLTLSNSQPFWQIGTDQGLLPAPVELKSLSIAPAERADLIVDFAGQGGDEIIFRDDAYVVMQFRVAPSGRPDTSSLPQILRPETRIPESRAVRTRLLTLNEYVDLAQNPVLMLLNATYWRQAVTEKPTLGTTEIWSFANLTEDSHPIHLHLVRFQLLDRRRFDVFQYQTFRRLRYTGPAVLPDPGEAGWKDTVRAAPGMVTRIIVPFEGYTGRYVWHCHILEHEDNAMMRPYEVLPSSA